MGRNQQVPSPRAWRTAAAAVTWALALSPPAHAALDSAETLFEKAAQQRAEERMDTLRAEGRQLDPRAPLRWSFEFGEAHVLEFTEADRRILVRGRRRFDSVGSGPVRTRPDPWLTFVTHNRRDPGGRRGMEFLSASGIDGTVVSLTRQERRPVYILGAKPWEPERPQLWLDKESLLPVRWIRLDDGRRVETRWLGFHGPVTGPYFPRRMERRVDGELEWIREFDRVEINVPVDRRRLEAPG